MLKFGIVLVSTMMAHAIAAQEVPPQTTLSGSVKAAWEWTVDERIAKRVDAEAMRERLAAQENFSPAELAAAGVLATQDTSTFVIEGRRDPALFLPHELFVSILSFLHDDAASPSMIRKAYGEKIRDSGWDEEHFWRILREATVDYRRVQDERLMLEGQARSRRGAMRQAVEEKAETLNVAGCRLRADALDIVRQKLGAAKFDRFLYEKVAPNIGISSSDYPLGNEEWRLRYVVGGCR